MRDLFKNECLRFRHWLVAATLLHAAVLGFFGRMVDPLQQPDLVYQVAGMAYGLVGLLLGLYQMGGYRRPNTWVYLLHRPLPPARVATALALAAALLLLVAIALPLWLLVGGQQALSARVVDARHWLLPLAAWQIATAGYLAGACALLAPARRGAFALVLPTLLFAATATGLAAIAVQSLLLVLLFALLLVSFKPDLSALPAKASHQALVALPVVMGTYFLLVMGSIGYQLVWMLVGSHPLNSTPAVGGFVEASRAEARERLLAGLEPSEHGDAGLWREQVRLSETYALGAQFADFPVRHQLTNPSPLQFTDETRRLSWTFSHDVMRFQGVSLADRRRTDALGVGVVNGPFALPPLPLDNQAMVTARALYGYDTGADAGRISVRFEVPAGETLASTPASAGEAMAVLSDRALYFLDRRALATGEQAVQPHLRLPLPGRIGDLADVDLVELLDGYLVSFLFGHASIDAPGSSWQEVWLLHEDGRSERVARRALVQDFPLALRHHSWWLSPVVHDLRLWVVTLFAEPSALKARGPTARPHSIQALAGALSLLSLLLAGWWLHRLGLGRSARVGWLLACAVLGLPALIALRLLHPEREREPGTPALA